MIPCERLTGRAGRVKGIGLAPASVRWPCRPYNLDDPLLSLEQERRQASTEATGALDCPHPTPRRHLRHETQQAPITKDIRRDNGLRDDSTSRVANGDRMRIAVRVDSDYVIHLICQHPLDLPCEVDVAGADLGKGTARQHCDGSHPHGWTGF